MNLIGFKVCLASEMKAVVTSQGQPAADATIIRIVNFNNKDYTTDTHTDNAGNFVLPPLYERTVWKNTPFENLMLQKVFISYKGEAHLGVEITKRNFDVGGELNEKTRIKRGMASFSPYQFSCELTGEEFGRSIKTGSGTIQGKCLIAGEASPKKISNEE